MEHAPPEIWDNLKAHASMLNVPGLGVDGNDTYSAIQINIQSAQNYGESKLTSNYLYFSS